MGGSEPAHVGIHIHCPQDLFVLIALLAHWTHEASVSVRYRWTAPSAHWLM